MVGRMLLIGWSDMDKTKLPGLNKIHRAVNNVKLNPGRSLATQS